MHLTLSFFVLFADLIEIYQLGYGWLAKFVFALLEPIFFTVTTIKTQDFDCYNDEKLGFQQSKNKFCKSPKVLVFIVEI
jgi:hypothetical protein